MRQGPDESCHRPPLVLTRAERFLPAGREHHADAAAKAKVRRDFGRFDDLLDESIAKSAGVASLRVTRARSVRIDVRHIDTLGERPVVFETPRNVQAWLVLPLDRAVGVPLE